MSFVIVSKDERILMRRISFLIDDVEEVLTFLRNCHATGTLSIHLSQGGVGAIDFRDEQKVSFEDTNLQ